MSRWEPSATGGMRTWAQRASRLAAESFTDALKSRVGSPSKRLRREEVVVTRREESPTSERPRGLAGVLSFEPADLHKGKFSMTITDDASARHHGERSPHLRLTNGSSPPSKLLQGMLRIVATQHQHSAPRTTVSGV